MRELLRAYFDQLATQFGLSVPDPEATELPGEYVAPGGVLLLAWHDRGQAIGCVGVRPLAEPGCCELKRLYVSPGGRGNGAGRLLLSAAIEAAAVRHHTMRLDTYPGMKAAIALYRSAGFEQGPPYGDGAAPGLLYFSRTLAV